MKNSEKNSSKANTNNTNNNEVLSPKTIKLQLQAACANMDAAQTKEYIKGLAGYTIRQTGANPDRTHATIYFGEMRVCNVENVQGITKDGSSRGCVSVVKVNFADSLCKMMFSKYDKIKDNLTEEEDIKILTTYQAIENLYDEIQCIFDAANERAAAAAKEAAKLKRDTEKGKKAAEKLDNSTLLQVLIAKGINEVEAKKLLNIA